jgi:GAF domain-containing protein
MSIRAKQIALLLFIGLAPMLGVAILGAASQTKIRSAILQYDPTLRNLPRFQEQSWDIWVSFIIVTVLIGMVTVAASYLLGTRTTSRLQRMADETRLTLQDIPAIQPLPAGLNDLEAIQESFSSLADKLKNVQTELEHEIEAGNTSLLRRQTIIEAFLRFIRESVDNPDLKDILVRGSEIITEQFGFYHTGIYLVDDAGEYAILQAANREEGHHLRLQNHKIKAGQGGAVDFVISNRLPHLISETRADPGLALEPSPQETRSELALPIRIQHNLIGVLDVHTARPEAFSTEDLSILEVLAGLVALAIQNTRLAKQIELAHEELKNLYHENIQDSWQRREGRKPLAYKYDRISVEPFNEEFAGNNSVFEQEYTSVNDRCTITVPLRSGDQLLGSLVFHREVEEGDWNSEEENLLEEIARQVAPTLEKARLMEEVQQRALQESLIGKISARTQSSLDMDTVIKTAVQEIALALPASRVQIRMEGEHPEAEQAGAGEGDGAP